MARDCDKCNTRRLAATRAGGAALRAWCVSCIAATLLASCPAGCASSNAGRDAAMLTPSPRPYERDIPLPIGFRLTDQESEDWSGGSIRYVRHRYEGRADKHEVRRFYREQMPLARWSPVSDANVNGRCTQRFVRGPESCTINIEDNASAWSRRVRIDVLIVPSGETEAAQARLP